MPHRRKNIVLGGVGVRVRRKDEEVERTMVFHHIFQVSQGLLATMVVDNVLIHGCVDSSITQKKTLGHRQNQTTNCVAYWNPF